MSGGRPADRRQITDNDNNDDDDDDNDSDSEYQPEGGIGEPRHWQR